MTYTSSNLAEAERLKGDHIFEVGPQLCTKGDCTGSACVDEMENGNHID